jgi:hypothetical protein
VQEWPQIAFTVRAIHEELRGIPHEIVVADNMCPYALLQQWGLGRGPVDAFMCLSPRERNELYKYSIKHGRIRPLDKGHARPKNAKKTVYDWQPPRLEDWYTGKIEVDPSHFAERAKRLDWLQYVHYDEKLSHWNAKNAAVAVARGRLLFFVDGHVIPGKDSMRRAVEWYEPWVAENGPGTFNPPLTYHIMEDKRLTYSFVHEVERSFLTYTWAGYPAEWDDHGIPQEVPVMSLCGMLCSREMYDQIGGFPASLGIYGGGENFWNFTRATLGWKCWIVPGNPIHHYGNDRHYHWLDGDMKKNRAVAAYMYGGDKWLEAFCRNHNKYKRDTQFFERTIQEVREECAAQRQNIKAQQVKEIEAWIAEHSPNT